MWPVTWSHLSSQRHFTKSTNYTYLSSCFWWLTFLIHQISFIYCWEPASYITLLRSPQAAIPFFGKCSLRHHTLLGLISPPRLLSYNYWAVGSKMVISWSRTFFGSYPQFGTRKVWWPIARLAGRSKYGTMGCRHFNSIMCMDLVGWLIWSL